MARNSWLGHVYLTLFSKPAQDRQVYRMIKRHQISNIVEIGIGDGLRASRMISTAKQYSKVDEVSYVGIDLFEGRPSDEVLLTLKQAHRMLSSFGRKVRLIPGDPMIALSRFANTLTDTQLLVISADIDSASLDEAWFYVPRMLADDAMVIREEVVGEKKSAKRISLSEVQQLADVAARNNRSAA